MSDKNTSDQKSGKNNTDKNKDSSIIDVESVEILPADELNGVPSDAPKGWMVRIVDQSGAGAGEDDTVEEVKGFHDLAHANAFARAYVRDSVERCRVPGATPKETLDSWLAFGENAEVADAGEDGWKSSSEMNDFVTEPATVMERDWRALDPRRLVDEADAVGAEAFKEAGGEDEDDLDDDDLIEIIRHNREAKTPPQGNV